MRQIITRVFLVLALGAGLAQTALAADKAGLEAFLKVTGFDVALESMRIGAQDAPQMIGMEASDFGILWADVADEVFEPEAIRKDAMQLLGAAMSDEMLEHAADFYASDLGQRLVEVENAAHASDDDGATAERGEALVAGMVEAGSARLEMLKRMNHAIDPENVGIKASQEVQIRFLLAASDAGVIDRIDEATLRSLMEDQAGAVAIEVEKSALANSAAVYEGFSDAELEAYAEALEAPLMQDVYELMNGVQYAIMADRYEQLAVKMGELGPGQEL